MQMHKEPKVYDQAQKEFLRKYLPRDYVKKVLDRLELKENDENRNQIKLIRYGRKRDQKTLKIIFEVADECKKIEEEIIEIVNN